MVKYSGVKLMFRLLSLCTKTAYIEIELIKKAHFFMSKVEFLMFFVSFKIPDYLRTSATGVRTSEKLRPLAPQDK